MRAVAMIVFITMLAMIGIVFRSRQAEGMEEAIKISYDEQPNKKLSEVYDDRGKHVSEMCAKHKTEIFSRYKKWWPHTNLRSVKGKADVLYNNDIGFLWCRVPKAASESWTGVFTDKWSDLLLVIYTALICIHRRYKKSSKMMTMAQKQNLLSREWEPKERTAKYIQTLSENNFSYMTTRHPLERLLSAYR